MSVNIYDDMNKLESTLRKTDEYVAVKTAMADVKGDEHARALFESFREIQMNLQQKQMAGEEIEGGRAGARTENGTTRSRRSENLSYADCRNET